MQVINKSTGTGIPYATISLYDDGGNTIFQSAADASGNIPDAEIGLFLISGNDVVISAAGFVPYAASASTLLSLMSNQIILTPTILPAFVFTAIRKAKQNPIATIAIVIIIIFLIIKRNKVVKVVNSAV